MIFQVSLLSNYAYENITEGDVQMAVFDGTGYGESDIPIGSIEKLVLSDGGTDMHWELVFSYFCPCLFFPNPCLVFS